jgi:lipid A 4'-phosphatase
MSEQRRGVYQRRRRQADPSPRMLKLALSAGVFAFLLFTLVPDLDIAVARLFYGDGHFAGRQLGLVTISRTAFNVLFVLTCIVAAAGLIVAGRTARTWLGLDASKWLFLSVRLLAGPLVVANIGLKDHWGRARPRDVIEFGGHRTFTPPFQLSNQCQHNCSFVPGEASSIYTVFFAAAFLFRSRARSLASLGVIAGSLAGLSEWQRAHIFLSDVVFEAIAMALTTVAVQLIFDTIKSVTRAELAESTAIQRKLGNDRMHPFEMNLS